MRRALVGLIVAFSLTPALAQPKLEVVGGRKLDLGEIVRGTVVERIVTLKNVGDQPLGIIQVQPSCGCTGTLMSSNSIAPGDTGTIKISFNSKNFSGRIDKTVTINSDSENEPRIVVEFTGVVKVEVAVTPAQFWFRNAEVGRMTSGNVTIVNKGKNPLSLTGFSTELDGFTLKLPAQPIAPGDSAQIEAEYTPKAVRSVVSDGVLVNTNNPLQPEVYIYIYGSVKEFKFQ